MNDVMKFFGQQVAEESLLMKSKSLSLLLNKFVRGRMAKSRSLKPLTTAHSNPSATVCSARAFSVL